MSRAAPATAYLLGTLTGALALPWAGRLIDAYGARGSMLVVAGLVGFITSVSVGSTAFGPLMFAVPRDAAGSYTPALLGPAVLPLVVLRAGFSTRPPTSHDAPVRRNF